MHIDFAGIVGLVAAACTTISLMPQIVRVIRTKDTSSISLGMYVLYSLGTALWLIYGIISGNIPVIAAKGIAVVLAAIILTYKIRAVYHKSSF